MDLNNNIVKVVGPQLNQSEFGTQYVSVDQFNIKFKKMKQQPQFKLFHLNMRSLNAHKQKLKLLLDNLTIEFDVICISEVWQPNIQFLTNCISGY